MRTFRPGGTQADARVRSEPERDGISVGRRGRQGKPAIVGLQEVAVGREDPARERVEAAVLSQFFPVLMPAELTASTGRRIHVLDR